MADKTLQGGHVYDLDVGESAHFEDSDGVPRTIALLEVHEQRDSVRGVIRFPGIVVEINGERADIPAALYNMPGLVNGIRIGCSVTRGISDALKPSKHVFGLDRDARIRCWDAEGPLFGLKPWVYPVGQVWFAGMTQLGNERCYVDAGEMPLNDPKRHIYHHSGIDIGGYDKGVPLLAAVGGKVIRRGTEWASDEKEEYEGRYDSVVIRDEAGWLYSYAHIDMIEPSLKAGDYVEAGATIGMLGKTGSSGGWSHLHFGCKALQPSGRYGELDGYPFLVEAYLNEHPGALLACARPHRIAAVGQPVELDASRSICDGGNIAAYAWSFHDGGTAHGERVTREYAQEGMYSEMLTVTDDRGNTDVDFCVVQILPPDSDPAKTPPSMNVAYYPTHNLKPGQPIAFKVRTFWEPWLDDRFKQNRAGEELWDFGDGTTATTCSDNDYDERWHAYGKPGRYIVTVRRTGKNNLAAMAQVKVVVGE